MIRAVEFGQSLVLRGYLDELRTPEAIYRRRRCRQCAVDAEGYRLCLKCETIWDDAVPSAEPRAKWRPMTASRRAIPHNHTYQEQETP